MSTTKRIAELCARVRHVGSGFTWSSELCRTSSEILESAAAEVGRVRELFPRKWWSKEEIGERAMRHETRRHRGEEIVRRLRVAAAAIYAIADRVESEMVWGRVEDPEEKTADAVCELGRQT